MELIQDPLVAKVQNAISVMLARSKTIGEPYDLSYEQLAKIIDFPGIINQRDIEAAMNNNPNLAGYITNFDESGLEVDSNAQAIPAADQKGELDITSLPPPNMSALPDLSSGVSASPTLPLEPTQSIEEPLPGAAAGPNLVQQMAGRAAKRRMK